VISLHYACIQWSGIILTHRLPTVSVTNAVAELATEKNRVLNHSLIPGNRSFCWT